MAKTSAPKADARWRAEADAHILAEAKAIMSDSARMKAAANVAKDMVAEKAAELKGLKQVARKAK